MEIALIIDKDSVFNTVNFNKILKELENEENIKIVTYVYLKSYFSEDFICALTDKYDEQFITNMICFSIEIIRIMSMKNCFIMKKKF